MDLTQYQDNIRLTVAQALAEDIGSGDITAQLIPETQQSHARIISREMAVIAGRPWVDEVFQRSDGRTGDFQASCTPSYYNNEGKPKVTQRVDNFFNGTEPDEYFNILEAWRESGELPGMIKN